MNYINHKFDIRNSTYINRKLGLERYVVFMENILISISYLYLTIQLSTYEYISGMTYLPVISLLALKNMAKDATNISAMANETRK